MSSDALVEMFTICRWYTIRWNSNDVTSSQFNALVMVGRGFINLPLSGKS